MLEMKRGPSGKGRAKGNAKAAMKGTEGTSHRVVTSLDIKQA